MLTLTQRQFFALLRSGLWGTEPDASLFLGGADWMKIYQLSARQTVFGHVGDGIALQVAHSGIPEEDSAPVDIRKKFLVQVVKTERRNQQLNGFITRFNSIFSAVGIVPVIVKGQGVAQSYRIPGHRMSGDIDYLLLPEEYEKAKTIVEPLASEVEKENPASLHYNCTVEGITVELHGSIIDHTSRRHDAALSQFLAENRAKPLLYWELEDQRIPLMNHHFNMIYILQHFHHHMLTSGVGLRQICDWIMYISAWRDTLDEKALRRDLERLSLLRPWKVYAAFAVDLLGMPASRMPLYDPAYSRYTERIWRIIDKTGNFGKYEKGRAEVGMQLHRRKFHSLLFILKQTSRLFPVFPADASRRFIRGISVGMGRLNTD